MVRKDSKENPIVLLSGGTDGTDGPTDAAGASGGAETIEWLAKAFVYRRLTLQNHDAYHFFEQTRRTDHNRRYANQCHGYNDGHCILAFLSNHIMPAYYLLFLLVAAILFIVWLTAYKKVNAFVALLLAALSIGLLSGLPLGTLANHVKAGFGHTMEKIGLTHYPRNIAGRDTGENRRYCQHGAFILKKVKEKNAPAAIAITGFIIGFLFFATVALWC